MPAVDLATLEKALAQLETCLDYCTSAEASSDPKLAEVFRSAAIQAFEFTYELGHKVLRRYIDATEPSGPSNERLSFPELVRVGYDRGIVSGPWRSWAEYRRLRALTSHTYNAGYAMEVFAAIPSFHDEIRFMLAAMRKAPAP